jgi:NMD protein affecting ribosome stability and mRNA decay
MMKNCKDCGDQYCPLNGGLGTRCYKDAKREGDIPVYRTIICEVCGKKDNLDALYREKWFIENIAHQICSENCFNKQAGLKGMKEIIREALEKTDNGKKD